MNLSIEQNNQLENLSVQEKCLLAFNEPRRPGDIDLVGIVYVLIKHNFGEKKANEFLYDSDVMFSIYRRPLVQKTAINRFFTKKLLLWRNTPVSIPVWQVLPYLHVDGTDAEWVRNFCNAVIPFLKINVIL